MPNIISFTIGVILLIGKYVATVIGMFLLKDGHEYHDFEGWVGVIEVIGSFGIGVWF